MGIVDREINGILAPVDEDEWETDKDAVIEEVMKNRAVMQLHGPDTQEEAQILVEQNTLPEEEFDPKDFGHETIEFPPTAGD